MKGNQQSSIQISDLMSFPVDTVTPDMSMKQVAHLLRKKGYTGLPVTEGDTVTGIISRRDFKKVKPKKMDSPVKAFMRTNVIQINEGSTVVQAARLMIKHDIGRLPVVKEGKLIGIITRSDTIRYYYDLLPEQ